LGGQARRASDGAIDILNPAASNTDCVVVIIAGSGFEESSRPRGIKLAQHIDIR